MSEKVELRIPELVADKLNLPRPDQLAVPLISLDKDGYPHAALLSVLEFLSVDDQLYFFLSRHSNSASNLKQRAACTALFLSPEGIFYLKGRAIFTSDWQSQSVFRLELTDVRHDFPDKGEGTVGLLSGLTFSLDPAHLKDKLSLRRKIREQLP